VAHPQVAVFARLADAGAEPVRKLEGQATLLGRTIHGIAYNSVRDEFVLPVPFPQAILTFRGGADGEEAPVRVIQGPRTRLVSPRRLALDPVHGEIFVPAGDDEDAIFVFDAAANGDVAPIRILRGPDTGLGANDGVAVDPVRNLIVVAGSGPEGARFRIFDRTAQGNVRPKAVIGGPKSGLREVSGPFIVYPPKGWIVSGDRGEGGMASNLSYVGVWSIEDNGDVPPRWRFGGPNGPLQMPRAVTLNPAHKEVMVSDKWLNAVLTFHFPEIF
jgi:hypothetical protein